MAISQIWTLTHGADTKTLAAWGITGVKIQRRNQAVGKCTLELAGTAFDEAEIFSFKDTVTIKRSGAVWFQATVTRTPRMARPRNEGVVYEVSSPEWWLENTIYEQDTYYFVDGVAVAQPATAQILSTAVNGDPMTTVEQIEDAIECAIGGGAPIQLGTIETSATITVPSEVGHDLGCLEVIRRMMRWHPDCLMWIDPTTAPHPSVNVKPRASLTAANFSIAGRPATSIDIAARNDLVAPVVALNYTQTNIVDDVSQIENSLDVYPPIAPNQVGAVRMTMDLQGSRSSYLRQDIQCTPIFDGDTPILGGDIGFWMDKNRWLSSDRIDLTSDGLGIVEGSLMVAADGEGTAYLYALTQGNIPQWLLDSAPGYHTNPATISVLINYNEIIKDDDGNILATIQHQNVEFKAKVISTDLPGGSYSQLDSFEPGEDVPTGLAFAYWTALQQLQYEGGHEITEKECGNAGGPWMGYKINLTGGIGAWATMNEMISEVEEDIATGRTQLRFGPQKFLGPKDNLELIRMNRTREPGNRFARATGQQIGGAQPIGGPAPSEGAGQGSKDPDTSTISTGWDGDGNPTTTQTLSPTIVGTPNSSLDIGDVYDSQPDNVNLQMREIYILADIDWGDDYGPVPSVVRTQCVCSEPYDPIRLSDYMGMQPVSVISDDSYIYYIMATPDPSVDPTHQGDGEYGTSPFAQWAFIGADGLIYNAYLWMCDADGTDDLDPTGDDSLQTDVNLYDDDCNPYDATILTF